MDREDARIGTFILVTVGTSLPGHLKRELGSSGLPSHDEAVAFLKRQKPFAHLLGAEINATEQILSGLRLSSGAPSAPFEICFIVSETPEGRWTGELLERYYRKIRGIEKSSWKEIEGLSPSDPDRFTGLGLRSLVSECAKLLREAAGRGLACVISATGGFKAQISVAALLGQIMGAPVVYLFEGFHHFIETPAIPLEIDKEVWLTNYDLYAKLEREQEVTEKDFPFYEVDSRTIGLLERRGENGSTVYSLSAAVELMRQGFLSQWAPLMEEPPAASGNRKPFELEDNLDRNAKGESELVRSMVNQFPWIVQVRNHSRGLDSARCRLLPRTPDPAVHAICLSDGKKAVAFSVTTTAHTERHVTYVRVKLAEFLANLSDKHA